MPPFFALPDRPMMVIMGKKDLTRALSEVSFRCEDCRATFKAAPVMVESDDDQPHHPFAYWADCPYCGAACGQAPHEKALLKAWANATGPKTKAGMEKVAANLAGHPTPEETLRTRFNAMKHGLNAEVATYFPARPGRYARCKSCEIDHEYCRTQPACQKQTELFLRHHAAFEQRDPRHLTGIYANLQASLFAVLQDILQTIIGDGAKLVTPEWTTDKDGGVVIAQFVDPSTGATRIIQNVQAHPLFKPLSELLSRNSLSLADMGMTMKEVKEDQAEMGRLSDAAANRELVADYMRRQSDSLEALQGMLARAKQRADADPILVEYQKQNGDAAS